MTRLALLAALALAGCSLLPSPSPSDYDILVQNGTTLEVGLRDNGTIVRVFPPGVGGGIAASSLPALPWTVEAVTPGGRVLASMPVAKGSVGCTDRPDGFRECEGALGRADLSCGRFDMFVGDVAPGGPAPGPGEPGDCVP
jgi:hypothetical protein